MDYVSHFGTIVSSQSTPQFGSLLDASFTSSPSLDTRNGNRSVAPGAGRTHNNSTVSSPYSACIRESSLQPKVDLIPRANEFDITRVISGSDSRTTFMIRNIPNKYTQRMLIDFINESHKGCYDFLYLRMDFTNRCNMGYAFINFVDSNAVISFAQKVVGKKWTKFNSDKVCMLSYANIQGKQALIERFRNSSVMEEPPAYRPKIFFTSGPNKGEEEPFPPPKYKRRRSSFTACNASAYAGYNESDEENVPHSSSQSQPSPALSNTTLRVSAVPFKPTRSNSTYSEKSDTLLPSLKALKSASSVGNVDSFGEARQGNQFQFDFEAKRRSNKHDTAENTDGKENDEYRYFSLFSDSGKDKRGNQNGREGWWIQ
ncbi:RNA recognition motif 2-domain-containing protein [Paraphysoderma sedebokerense]|nr:RNA recognition motif 2-domain-containing protein [Paraphysoderma sedebokerense]KAI9141271.1 RNA recognition motif 2-domain-containing protein [Paraphysoderma sedebokerense]